jgi:hypothetical protein
MKLLRQSVLKKQGILMPLLVMGLIVSSSLGQYELSWYTIDGGGERSSNGQYELLDTIGQPDAAYSRGGQYELLGGFWPGGPLCFVDFYSFARFAEWWLEDCTELNEWCSGADFEPDGDVDPVDLKLFVEEWLYNCPPDWELK